MIFAGIIAFGVVYNAARISLSERSRELASLRVLGFTRGEISSILLGELAVLTLSSLPLGAVIGYGLGQVIMVAFENEVYRLPSSTSPATIAWVVSDRDRGGGRLRSPRAGGGSIALIWWRFSRHGSDDECCACSPTVAFLFRRCRRRPARRVPCGRDVPRSMWRAVSRGPLVVTVDEEGVTRVRDRFVVSAPYAGRVLRIELEPGDPCEARPVVARVRAEAPPLLDARTRAEAEAGVASARRARPGARGGAARQSHAGPGPTGSRRVRPLAAIASSRQQAARRATRRMSRSRRKQPTLPRSRFAPATSSCSARRRAWRRRRSRRPAAW